MNGLVINPTHSSDGVAIVVAGASVASAQETTVFLLSEGVALAKRGVADELHEDGFAPMSELGGVGPWRLAIPSSAIVSSSCPASRAQAGRSTSTDFS